jgi:acetyl esterase
MIRPEIDYRAHRRTDPMPLDPESQGIITMLADAGFPDIAASTPGDVRAFLAAMAAASPPGPDMAKVEDIDAGGVPARVYTPEGESPKPLFVYYHGGGWVLGTLAENDAYCRILANLTGAVVVSVDYRMAPEHVFPAAAEDCYAATVWVAENAASIGGDADRLVVGGDSAGGNLAAVVSQLARDRGGPKIRLQVLSCPVTDHDFERPSYRENASGYLLQKDTMIWFFDHYTPNVADRDDPRCSPLRASSLENLPPAYVITAGYDPLRDEGAAYADALKDAGNQVTYKNYPDQFHVFNTMAGVLPRGHAAADEIAAAVRAAVA